MPQKDSTNICRTEVENILNKKKCNKNINEIEWNDKIGNFDDVDDMCNEFTKTFLEIARDCIPTKEIIIREKGFKTQ
jgi:hypothetical protein